MVLEFAIDIETVKGFLAVDEGEALYQHALATAAIGPCLEIGSYCGKSSVYLGSACQRAGSVLYAVDHHQGSEEHQPGEAYHDPSLYDADFKVMDSFRIFRQTIRQAQLDDTVIPIVAPSKLAARYWSTPLGMVFIDGGHSEAAALNDFRAWATHVAPGGILAIHDIFANPEDGGQAPYHIYQLAVASGLFDQLPQINTLGLLRRRS